MEKRCVITGLGLICAAGNDVDTCWQNICAGKTGIDEVKSVSTEGCVSHVGAEVHCEDLPAPEYDRSVRLCGGYCVGGGNIRRNAYARLNFAVYLNGDFNLAVNGQPAFMPDGVTHIRAEDKPGGVQRVVIKEGVLPIDGFLHRRVVIRVLRGLNLKVHMKLGPGCLAVLLQHVMPAEGDGVADIRHHLIQLFRRNPLRRVLRVVVVAVHDENIGLPEVLLAAVVVVILRAHVIHFDGFLKFLGAGNLRPVWVEAVLFITDEVRCLQNQFHACPSILCLCLCS